MRDYVGGFRGAGGMVLMWSLGFGVFACMAGVVWRATVLSSDLMKGLTALMMVFFWQRTASWSIGGGNSSWSQYFWAYGYLASWLGYEAWKGLWPFVC